MTVCKICQLHSKRPCKGTQCSCDSNVCLSYISQESGISHHHCWKRGSPERLLAQGQLQEEQCTHPTMRNNAKFEHLCPHSFCRTQYGAVVLRRYHLAVLLRGAWWRCPRISYLAVAFACHYPHALTLKLRQRAVYHLQSWASAHSTNTAQVTGIRLQTLLHRTLRPTRGAEEANYVQSSLLRQATPSR